MKGNDIYYVSFDARDVKDNLEFKMSIQENTLTEENKIKLHDVPLLRGRAGPSMRPTAADTSGSSYFFQRQQVWLSDPTPAPHSISLEAQAKAC